MKNKDLKECLAVLKALRSDNNLKPEQKEQVDIIISRVKKLGRGQKPTHAEAYACVNEVTKRLLAILDSGK